MTETWSLLGERREATGSEAAELVSRRVHDHLLTTYFESDRGRILTVVSNGTRAMVVLMDGEGDPGEHAVSTDAVGSSGGYVLENGQEDTYDDAETIPMVDALSVVRSVVDTGGPPGGVLWSVDRRHRRAASTGSVAPRVRPAAGRGWSRGSGSPPRSPMMRCGASSRHTSR
ncbi:hypothetical protein Q9R29_05490 [Rothia sp. ARF10]|nr:hypothetical protein [Rothia sp. ARF10]